MNNTFTIKADVIFHAEDQEDSEPCIAAKEMGNVEFESLGGTGNLEKRRPRAGDYLQGGHSSERGFQNHIQPTDGGLKKQSDSLSKNGVKEGANGATAERPLTGMRSATSGDMARCCETDVMRSPSVSSNMSSLSQDSFSDSKENRSSEQTLASPCFLQAAAHGQFTHEAEREAKHSGNQLKDSVSPREKPDLVIEVGKQKLQVHKSVLAEKSDYFKARLSRDILKVKGVSYKTLSVLLDYVYTSNMNVNKENVVDVVTGAKILQIPCAVQAAVDGMSAQLTTQNCYEVLAIAKRQRLSELREAAYRFMSDNFMQVLKDPAVYGRLTGSERDLVLRNRMEGCKCLMVAEISDVFERVGSRPPSRGNSRPQSPLSVTSFEDNHMIYYYNENAKDWRTLAMMPEDINTKGCGICCLYNYLFVAGGIRGYGEKGKASDKVFCYNPRTDRWSEIRPMNQARSQLKLVSMDGFLYAVGGECLFTVEKYDPRMDRWTNVAPLPKGAFAVAHEATTCNGELYVSGGTLFYRLLKYDPRRDEWQECPYNNSRKKSSDMVALKSFIYRFDVNREQGINVFKYNTIVKMWQDCASWQQGSPLPFRCAVIGNRIYCVNKTQTLQFVVEEEGARFAEGPLKAPVDSKGVLFPFVLSLPDRSDRNV